MHLHIRRLRTAVLVAVSVLFFCVPSSFAQADPPGGELAPSLCPTGTDWFSPDKLCHFGVSAVGSAGLYGLGRLVGLSGWKSVAVSAFIVGSLGIWREIGTTDPADPLTRQNLSRKDLVWDGLGIFVGISAASFIGRLW